MDERPEEAPHRCRAMAKSTGQQCKNHPGPHLPVCHVHGGKAGQVVRRARRRAAEAEARQACEALGVPVRTTAEEALQTELGYTAGHVAWYRRVLAALIAEHGYEVLAAVEGAAVGRMYMEERTHLVRICRVMVDGDFRYRQLVLARETVSQFEVVLNAALDALGLSEAQRARAPEAVVQAIRLTVGRDDDDGAA
jgi:hypothetical protein